AYREVAFARTVGGKDQKADIRPAVRRMVVLRSDRGKKAPFSPDGPLTWGEIDVVRTDIFSPALVPGLLPVKPVRPGDRWRLTPAAVAELTDLDPIDEGELVAESVSVVTISNKRYAKLGVSGSVKGGTEDGTSRQKLDGMGYFDLEANRLTYLNLKGTRELLGPDRGDVHHDPRPGGAGGGHRGGVAARAGPAADGGEHGVALRQPGPGGEVQPPAAVAGRGGAGPAGDARRADRRRGADHRGAGR